MTEPHLLANLAFYLLFVGAAHLAVIAGGAGLAALFTRGDPIRFWEIIGRIVVFNVLLLLCGAAANLVWNWLFISKWYYNWDVFFDFNPYWIATEGILNPLPGQPQDGLAAGVEFWHLQLLWLVFATATWGATLIGYRRIKLVLIPE